MPSYQWVGLPLGRNIGVFGERCVTHVNNMFDYIVGQLVEKNPAYTVLKANGVAFKLLIPLSTYSKLPDKGEVKIYTFLYVQNSPQETSIRLYGFGSPEERRLFLSLAGVNRVGPTTALRILSGTSPSRFKQAVISNDLHYINKIRGVGAKTAQRIILELKDTLASWALPEEEKETVPKPSVPESYVKDAVQALMALGYTHSVAERVVKEALKKMPRGEIRPEDVVKKALQQA